MSGMIEAHHSPSREITDIEAIFVCLGMQRPLKR
jgi:hypothetical protein